MANGRYRTLEMEGEIYARALVDLKTRYPRYANDEISVDDQQALADTLEGETEFLSAAAAIVETIRQQKAWAQINADEAKRHQERKKRYEEVEKVHRDKLTKVLCDCVLSVQNRSLRLEDGTLLTVPREKRCIFVKDIYALPPSMVIEAPPSINLAAIQMDYEAGMLDPRYVMPGPRRADMDAIAAALDAKQEVPGVEITYTQPSLQIR